MGKVTFVGAGPYDASYLALAGKDALTQADCVLYDHLLDTSILSFTKGECIYVGKQGHHASMKQVDINNLLIKKALQYKHVVRLKGGDSFVFGRGGEEALALQEHQIPYTFIPGVTSAVAVAEMAGIPVTHRGLASGFLVLSAHLQNHELRIPINQVQNPDITVLFLMGNSRISQIVQLLLEAGRSKQTPIAIISNGCSPQQVVLCGALSNILAKVAEVAPVAPAIIVVGDVVSLREQIHIEPIYPLRDKSILVYKINAEPSPLAKQLRLLGAKVCECQSGAIQYQSDTKINDHIQPYVCLAFTSKHAIHGFFQALYKEGKDVRYLHDKIIAVIGSKTAEVFHSYGIQPDIIANGIHEGFLLELEKHGFHAKSTLYVCGEQASSLILHDEECMRYVVYDNKEIPQVHNHQVFDMVCFTCASSVERCTYDLSDATCISIGKTTTMALEKHNCGHCITAKEASYEAMVDAIVKEITDV